MLVQTQLQSGGRSIMSQKPLENGRSRSRARTRPLIAATALALVFGFASAATAAPLLGTTTRISVDSAGAQGNDSSVGPAVSGDGRYITYFSDASNLVIGDTNGARDVFLFDTITAVTTRISVDSAGAQGNEDSSEPSVSGDGRYITYRSTASNLVVGDSNNEADVFLFDRITAVTTRISVDSAAAQSDDESSNPSISGDGRYIIYDSEATNLVVGDTNGVSDVFLFDTITAVTTRISVDSAAAQSNASSFDPTISQDGRYIAYYSDATNLVLGDTNGVFDVFLFDRTTLGTTRVNVSSAAVQSNANSFNVAISGDGRYITHDSGASNLVVGDTNGVTDVFLFDTTTLATTRISVNSAATQSSGPSFTPAISGDGRYVTYRSNATNLVAGDTNGLDDVFLFDRTTLTTTRISVHSTGTQGNDGSFAPAISADGRSIAYESNASNLVASDTNGVADVFLFALPAAAATPALPAAGSDPIAPLAIAVLMLGAGVFTVSFYRRHRAS